ncbi:hypothetical protein KIW84_013057 [Lathyrus oleraceus]|uniref:Uncharacterized protein n=1 Tax=Pisum sativum TaxID=3888 RepID=A0A9D5BJ48_PEA|nr:hypothetical protein KIW84_013057 [Pisum sativum]
MNMLHEMVECGEVSTDMKRINFEIGIKEQCMKIPSTKVVLPEIKTEVLRSDHMSQLRVKHVSPLHNSNKKLHLKCHQYGYKEVHAMKKWNHVATSTSLVAHITRKGSSSKGQYYNGGHARDMSKEKTIITPGSKAKGRIKDLGKLVKPSRKEVFMRKGSSSNVISIKHMMSDQM